MSVQSPHALLYLAIESLLRDEALAVEALEDLPGELFPPLFEEAFNKGQTEVMKAMVMSWPLPSLHLGGLIRMRTSCYLQEDVMQAHTRAFQAVLDGLDVLLSQKVYVRRLRLQVLDMRIMHPNFWRVCFGNQLEDCSSESMMWRKTEKTGTRGPNKKTLKVLLDLWTSQEYFYPVASYLFKWVQEKADLVYLDCKRLCITTTCSTWDTEFLKILNFDSVQEVHVCCYWSLFILADFAPFLGQMQNLHKIILSDISETDFTSSEKREQLVTKITSQLLKLHCLKEMYMNSVSFLEGHLNQVLRCLASPLETLAVTHCRLSHSDWNLLPHTEQTRQLKHLDLSCISLTEFSMDPLRILLDKVADTLTTLYLENCELTDAQVCTFLPSLSCCLQLTIFCFTRNFMSIDTMKNLLYHTARMRKLNLELYSVPKEMHVPGHGVLHQIQNKIQEPLRRMMKPLNHPRTVWFCVHQELFCSWQFHTVHRNACPACVPI